MIELQPCPHCGNKVDYAYDLDLEPYGVHCVKCHMIVTYSRVKPLRSTEPFERIMDDIAVRWNRRDHG